MRPFKGSVNQSVFYRVVMNILYVPGKIILIPQLVFPKTALPDGPVPFCGFLKRKLATYILDRTSC